MESCLSTCSTHQPQSYECNSLRAQEVDGPWRPQPCLDLPVGRGSGFCIRPTKGRDRVRHRFLATFRRGGSGKGAERGQEGPARRGSGEATEGDRQGRGPERPWGPRGPETRHQRAGFFRVFLALEGHPSRADTRIQHFRAGVRGLRGAPRSRESHLAPGVLVRWSIGVYLWVGGPARAGHGRGFALGGTAKP